MAKSVLELAVGTGQWDAGLKKAKNALDNFTQANGGLQSALNKDSKSMQTFVQMMGRMDSTAKTAKGQMNDYKGTIEQLTMQYNRMTDAQKAAVGQTYLQAIDQMKQKYQGVAEEVQKINQSLKSMPEPAAMPGGGLFGSDKLSGMLQVFGGNLMTKGAGMVMSFAGEMKDMVAQGIELAKAGEGIRIAFQRLGRGDILDGLRKATHGTVTDLELMKAAVKFNDFKLPLDELGTMLAFAQQKAKDTGQSVDYMVDSIVTGLGRKSLMILDNLGLSATEIRDKMKETGDMTKAVGEIIREQMAKAGDYVETAADRAAQANVSLQNKMEELGRKFAPIEEASNQLWTSMKIGILDVVGGPLAKMLNSLTEAGRLMNALSSNNGEQGSGNTKVDQQLNKLRGSNYKQFYYNKVVENYTKQINDLQAQINNGGKKPGAGSGTSQDVRYLTAQKQSIEVMLGLFRSGAKDIMQPVSDTKPLPVEVKNPTGGGGRNSIANIGEFVPGEGVKNAPPEFKPMWDTAIFQDALRKELGLDGEQTRDWGKELGKVLPDYVADPDKEKRGKANKDDKETKKLTEKISTLTSGLSSIASGLKSMGIDLPKEVDQVIGIIQGVTSVIEGVNSVISIFSTSAMAANTAAIVANTAALIANSTTNLIPLAGGGIVPHAAGGYLIGGNNYSGDNIFAGHAWVNSGELVLNKAQQGNLASQLQGGGVGAMQLSAIITGEQLRLVLNNNGRRTGRGEYVTTNFR